MLTTDRQAAVIRRPVPTSGTATGTSIRTLGSTSCPDDCHYCSGPETD